MTQANDRERADAVPNQVQAGGYDTQTGEAKRMDQNLEQVKVLGSIFDGNAGSAVFAVMVGKPVKRLALFSSLAKAVEWIDTQDDDCIIAPQFVDDPDCERHTMQ